MRSSNYRLYFVGAALNVNHPQPIAATNDARALAEARRVFALLPTAMAFTLVAPMSRVVATARR